MIILLEGADHTGKTTLQKNLQTYTQSPITPLSLPSEKTKLYAQNLAYNPIHLSYNDKLKIDSVYFDDLIEQTITLTTLAKASDLIVISRFIPSYLAYTLSNDDSKDFLDDKILVYEALAEIWAKVDCVINFINPGFPMVFPGDRQDNDNSLQAKARERFTSHIVYRDSDEHKIVDYYAGRDSERDIAEKALGSLFDHVRHPDSV